MIYKSPAHLVWLAALAAPYVGVAQAQAGSDPVGMWLSKLASPVPREQRSAAYALKSIGPDPQRAAAELVQALKDTNPYIRRRAAVAIGDFRVVHELTSGALVKALVDPDARVREHATAALAKLGPAALPALLEALESDDSAPSNSRRDPNPQVASYAAAALVEMGPDAIPVLIDGMVKKGTDDYRTYVIEQSPAAAVAALTPYLRSAQEVERVRAARILAGLGTAAAPVAPLVISMIADTSTAVRSEATSVLTALGAKGVQAAGAVAKNLTTKDRTLFDNSLEALRVFGPLSTRVCEAVAARLAGGAVVRSAKQKTAVMQTLAVGCSGNPTAIRTLTGALRDRDRSVRTRAMMALGGMGSAAIPILTPHLRDADPESRSAAAKSLAAMGHAAAGTVPSLARLLSDSVPAVRSSAAEALAAMAPDASPATSEIIKALDRADFGDRMTLVETLGNIGPISSEVAAAVTRQMFDTNRDVASTAVKALDRFGPAALPSLIGSLDDPRPGRLRTMEVLRGMKLAAASTAPSLSRLMSDPSATVRADALDTLVYVLGDAALPHLAGAVKDSDTSVRRLAVEWLGRLKMGYDRLSPPLLAALGDSDASVREVAVQALRRFDEAKPAIEKARLDPDERVRRAAEFHPATKPNRLAELIDQLRSADEDYRVGAAEALMEYGPEAASAVPQLVAALDDPNEDVAFVSAYGLRALGADAGASAELMQALINDADVSHRISGSVHEIQIASGELVARRPAKRAPPPAPKPPPTGADPIQPVDANSLPALPWPMPKASQWAQIPDQLIGPDTATLNDVYATLHQLLAQTGFSEPGAFSAPGGFAMVTQVERIHADGSPYTGTERWTKGKLPLHSLSLSDYLSSLFFDTPGEFRLFVFVVSTQQPFQSDKPMEEDSAREMALRGGRTLPANIGATGWKDRHCYVLLYHFERKLGEPATVVRPEPLALKTHMEKAGMQALAH